MSGAAFNRGGSKQDYATPPDFIAAVEKRWGKIDFDLAASEHNKKATPYFSKEQDSLMQIWCSLPGNLWLNPPFDRITPWAEKCAKEVAFGATIFFLVPASVGANWFRDFVHRKAMVYFLNGRLHFDPNNPTWGYPKDCMLCVYSLGSHGYDTWTWK